MLDYETVDHVAELAKLGLTPDERELFREQLSKILDYVDQLSEVDVDDTAEDARAGAESLTLRADEVSPSLPREDVLANARGTRAGQFRVPPLLD